MAVCTRADGQQPPAYSLPECGLESLGYSTMAMVDLYSHLAPQRAADVSRVFLPMDRLKAGMSSPKSRGSRRSLNP